VGTGSEVLATSAALHLTAGDHLTPGQVLCGLHVLMAEHGIHTVGMDFGRLDG
jgi:hypothetical protein